MELDNIIKIISTSMGVQKQTETVSILESRGRILAENLYATMNVPHFPKSAMDGYAIRSEDSKGTSKDEPKKLQVVGEILAGECKDITAGQGEAVRVMTGSFVPIGFDCVIRQEDTDYGERKVTIYKDAEPYENYCKVGEDLKQGQLVLSKYRKLDEIAIGVLASLGILKVSVYKPMKAGVLSIGTELLEPGFLEELKPVLFVKEEKLAGAGTEFVISGQEPLPGKIYNSCGYILKTALDSKGIEVVFRHHLVDDEKEIEEFLLQQTNKADIIITTGGVSVGKKDLMPKVLGQISDEIYQGIKIKPGTPTICARCKDTWILSFSGNPYAVLAHYHMLFLPVAAYFTQDASKRNETRKAVIEEGYLKKSKLTRIVRAKEANGKVVINALTHASSVLSNMLDCNCIVVQPAGAELKAGMEVQIVMI